MKLLYCSAVFFILGASFQQVEGKNFTEELKEGWLEFWWKKRHKPPRPPAPKLKKPVQDEEVKSEELGPYKWTRSLIKWTNGSEQMSFTGIEDLIKNGGDIFCGRAPLVHAEAPQDLPRRQKNVPPAKRWENTQSFSPAVRFEPLPALPTRSISLPVMKEDPTTFKPGRIAEQLTDVKQNRGLKPAIRPKPAQFVSSARSCPTAVMPTPRPSRSPSVSSSGYGTSDSRAGSPEPESFKTRGKSGLSLTSFFSGLFGKKSRPATLTIGRVSLGEERFKKPAGALSFPVPWSGVLNSRDLSPPPPALHQWGPPKKEALWLPPRRNKPKRRP